MKITKRQLKQIIKEEYFKLNKNVLINESKLTITYSDSDMHAVAKLLSEGNREFIEQGLMVAEDLGLINSNYPIDYYVKEDNRMFMEKTLEIWSFVTPSLEFIQLIHKMKMANGLGGVGWHLLFGDEDASETNPEEVGWKCNLIYRKKHLQ